MLFYRRLSWFAVLTLVLLRLGIGFHFFQEGYSKVRDGRFSSAGFLGAAKGPLANKYKSLLPDHDGRNRLDLETMEGVLGGFKEAAIAHYVFSDEQSQQLDEAMGDCLAQIKETHAQWEKELYEYRRGRERIRAMERDPSRKVASLRAQKDEIETKWNALPKPALAAIDLAVSKLELETAGIATAQQMLGKPLLNVAYPGEPAVSVRTVDRIIPIFDMAIGILLFVGLLTPLAAGAAALFLISVVLSQFPGYPGTQPTYFQAVEALGCLVLATADAGRYAGLDFLPWSWWHRERSTDI
jgi:uncharacterized membrane protein YphA (DoxX/SURF4 family)